MEKLFGMQPAIRKSRGSPLGGVVEGNRVRCGLKLMTGQVKQKPCSEFHGD